MNGRFRSPRGSRVGRRCGSGSSNCSSGFFRWTIDAAQRQGDAFAQHALGDRNLARAIAESDAHLRSLLSSLVTRARSEGEVAPHVDPEVVAWAILALAQGLAAQLQYAPESEDAVRTRLSSAVGALLR